MSSITHDDWQEQADDPEVRIDGRIDAQREDAYWQRAYRAEAYYRRECSYDDYAPAYCVGYIGCAQYGGSFEEAEKSLCANWFRIKGDSCLSLDEAMQAIRAAWEHAGEQPRRSSREHEEELVEESMVAARATPARQPAYATA
jgi:hypothetical protein